VVKLNKKGNVIVASIVIIFAVIAVFLAYENVSTKTTYEGDKITGMATAKSCVFSFQCNDNDPCTTDRCIFGRCTNRPKCGNGYSCVNGKCISLKEVACENKECGVVNLLGINYNCGSCQTGYSCNDSVCLKDHVQQEIQSDDSCTPVCYIHQEQLCGLNGSCDGCDWKFKRQRVGDCEYSEFERGTIKSFSKVGGEIYESDSDYPDECIVSRDGKHYVRQAYTSGTLYIAYLDSYCHGEICQDGVCLTNVSECVHDDDCEDLPIGQKYCASNEEVVQKYQNRSCVDSKCVDGEVYTLTRNYCFRSVCQSGECVAYCKPNCEGKKCGDSDGCGGICKGCDSVTRTKCSVDGTEILNVTENYVCTLGRDNRYRCTYHNESNTPISCGSGRICQDGACVNNYCYCSGWDPRNVACASGYYPDCYMSSACRCKKI